MKKLLLLLLLLPFGLTSAFAQRYAVINSKYILEKIPEYKQAQQRLDSIAKQWQKEIDGQYQVISKMNNDYQAEQVMLSDELKKKREAEIGQKEDSVRKLQQQRFGYQGDLFKMRQELIKPIQDKVYNAVQQLAAKRLYDFILDKAGGISLFYYDPKLDKSDEVLQILGINK